MMCAGCRGWCATYRFCGVSLRASRFAGWLFARFGSRRVRSDGSILEIEPFWLPVRGFHEIVCAPCNGWGRGEAYPPVDVEYGPCPMCHSKVHWTKEKSV